MAEIDAAVIEEIVSPGSGIECPCDGIARYVGDHIQEFEPPFDSLEDTAPAADLVITASGDLEREIKGLAEAFCHGRIERVTGSESASPAAQLAYKYLPTVE